MFFGAGNKAARAMSSDPAEESEQVPTRPSSLPIEETAVEDPPEDSTKRLKLSLDTGSDGPVAEAGGASSTSNGNDAASTPEMAAVPVTADTLASSATKPAASTTTTSRKQVQLPQPPCEPHIFYHATDNHKAKFIVISNDNSERNLVHLVCLKEIFSKQLPKMPREYIVRLLFDRQHQSLLCLDGNQVVGGISFKPYPEQRFGEIAFCAVSATHQVKGFGTRLMNHLKEYVKRVGLTHFLTYADNFAVGYFKKQGFSSHISMPRERWEGYIKHYDGGTLMECVVNPKIDYFSIPALIKKQKAFLLEKILEVKKTDKIYPGLDKLLDVEKLDDPYTQIPGIKEAGWVKPVLQANDETSGASAVDVTRVLLSGVAGAELQTALKGVLSQVANHKESWPFHEPVPPSVPDYLEVIKEPIDLSQIRGRINAGYYQSPGGLRRDLQLMCNNCTTYNHYDTSYYKAGVSLQKLIAEIFGDIQPDPYIPVQSELDEEDEDDEEEEEEGPPVEVSE